jgi:transposase
VARDLDLTETALREWVRRAEIDAGKGRPGALTTAQRDELTQLRRENTRLLMEREILNKGGGAINGSPQRHVARRLATGGACEFGDAG